METNGKIVVGVVGANETNFGKWFMEFLRYLPLVSIILPEPENDIRVAEVVDFADIIIFTVPPNKLEQTVTEYNNADIPIGKLWIDVADVCVPPTKALCGTVADAVSLRFVEPSASMIECIHLPEKSIIYIYPLKLECSGTNFEYLMLLLQRTTGVKNIHFTREASFDGVQVLAEAV